MTFPARACAPFFMSNNTLYLTTSTNSVRLENDAFVVRARSPESGTSDVYSRVLIRDIGRIVISGSPNFSLPAIKSACRYGVPVELVSSSGKWLGEFSGEPEAHDASRRVAQYRIAIASAAALVPAKALVSAKIFNQRFVLKRLAARTGALLSPVLNFFNELRAYTDAADSVQTLRGVEGIAASRYFPTLSGFVPHEFAFSTRSRRPPRDPANALFSFAYSILYGETVSAIRVHGLDPCLGVLHASLPGRFSLALDLMETLRPEMDAFVLSLLNRKIFTAEDFRADAASGGVFIAPEAHAKFFRHYEKKMCREFASADVGHLTTLRKIIDWQVLRYSEMLGRVSAAPNALPPAPIFFKIPQ